MLLWAMRMAIPGSATIDAAAPRTARLPSAHRPTTRHPRHARPPIRLFLADVDGTLVTQDKVLTDDAVAAVRRLREAGVLFAITSGRPPRGMEMLVEPLAPRHADRRLQRRPDGGPGHAGAGAARHPRGPGAAGGRPHEVLRPRRLALPRGGLVRARPQGAARRPGGLDGQVRAQGDGEPRRADRRRRQARRGERRPRRHRQGQPTAAARSSATTSRRRPRSPTTST